MSRINNAPCRDSQEPSVGRITLHLLPVERLRNLVATRPAAVGIEWSTHVWDPFLPVQVVNRQASLPMFVRSLKWALA
ncbi:TPA: hypothetical protein ACH3X2_012492 [Trebouxia sp. C0005]